jgi:ABC-type antimicrobial peptide transport system permease subunit
VIASLAGLGGLGSFFSLGTWLIAIAGAFVLLLLYNAVTASRSDRRHPAH